LELQIGEISPLTLHGANSAAFVHLKAIA